MHGVTALGYGELRGPRRSNRAESLPSGGKAQRYLRKKRLALENQVRTKLHGTWHPGQRQTGPLSTEKGL